MCGNRRYQTVDVEGDLIVGTRPVRWCPAGTVGELRLRADDITFHQNSVGIVGPDGSRRSVLQRRT